MLDCGVVRSTLTDRNTLGHCKARKCASKKEMGGWLEVHDNRVAGRRDFGYLRIVVRILLGYGRLPAKTGSDTSTLKVLWLQVPLPAGVIPTGKFKGTCGRYLRYCIPVAFLRPTRWRVLLASPKESDRESENLSETQIYSFKMTLAVFCTR